MKISVVIPARNAAQVLPFQLDALVAQDFDGEFEVVVVDNASTDGTASRAALYGDRLNLAVVPCGTLGVNPARNAGATAARGDRILLCDADDVVDASWVREMDAALDSAALVGGSLEYEHLNDANAIAARGDLLAVDHLPLYRGAPYAVGGNLGVHRDIFESLGGFDPMLRLGGDEPDFSFRAAQAGSRAAFASRAVIHYRLRPGRRSMMKQFAGYAQGSAQLEAKLERLGFIPRQSHKSKVSAAKGHCVSLLKVAPSGVYARKVALELTRSLGHGLV